MEFEMNIPIYRAKKICRDDYAEGYLLESSVIISKKNIAKDGFLPIIVEEIDIIDPSTLAIHFQDMIDSEGNKIFASLSEDGKGGDMLENIIDNYIITFKYEGKVIGEENFGDGIGYYGFNLDLCSGYPPVKQKYKAIGIQQ